ncbi:glycosyltransferase family 4 protein [Rhodococcus sp. IEGM 1409]|uniref:glycosyltransferase family 4 protein n=1 Tax=Rhodococcus sp. IEGM 1409 TaxID=3047082 RepID=UPI0024B718DB|nr:glycosyltransferase family 4 protein [Rhodococcus sp. IEGM 1409]MDI9898530.1 glycosyltransferase family 4 protein [Rhodococcus sp. IEGM 1409]
MLNITLLGINYSPETTGIAPYMTDLAEELSARGHNVDVITGFPHYPAWEIDPGYTGRSIDEDINGVHVHRRRHFVPSPPNALGRIKMELSFGARSITSKWGTPDVIVCTSPALLATAMSLGRARMTPRRPAIGIWVHDLYGQGVVETGAMSGRSARATARLEAAVMKSADGLAVVHDRFVDHVIDQFGVSPADVTVVRNWTHVAPIAVGDIAAARARFGWAPDETVVLHTGNMGVKQGLENVVEAARLADAQKLPIRFVLVGDGNQRPALESAGAGIDRLDFVRPLDDEAFRTAMVSADILLVNEAPGIVGMAVPSKLTSYFSSGTAILAATDVESTTADEIRASGAGVVVPSGSPAGLLAAALELAGNATKSAQLGQAGLDYCAASVGKTASIDTCEQWIRELAARRGKTPYSVPTSTITKKAVDAR